MLHLFISLSPVSKSSWNCTFFSTRFLTPHFPSTLTLTLTSGTNSSLRLPSSSLFLQPCSSRASPSSAVIQGGRAGVKIEGTRYTFLASLIERKIFEWVDKATSGDETFPESDVAIFDFQEWGVRPRACERNGKRGIEAGKVKEWRGRAGNCWEISKISVEEEIRERYMRDR